MRNSLGEKSPTVRLQISFPLAASARISLEIFRISEPVRPRARVERQRSSGRRSRVAGGRLSTDIDGGFYFVSCDLRPAPCDLILYARRIFHRSRSARRKSRDFTFEPATSCHVVIGSSQIAFAAASRPRSWMKRAMISTSKIQRDRNGVAKIARIVSFTRNNFAPHWV